MKLKPYRTAWSAIENFFSGHTGERAGVPYTTEKKPGPPAEPPKDAAPKRDADK